MTLQHRPQCAELSIPQSDSCVPTATGQRASIRTPGQGFHPLGMSHQRLETASTGELPQLDGAIPARADKNAAIGGKGQAAHQIGMPGERLHAGCWLAVPDLPEPGRARDVATCEQAPIRAPGSREDRTGMRYVLHSRTSPRLLTAAQYCPPRLMATAVMASKASLKTHSRITAPARVASCMSTPCKYAPRIARRERSRPRRSLSR